MMRDGEAIGVVMSQPTVFISYSHKDECWKDRLQTHLRVLQLHDRSRVWDDRQIDAGDTWYDALKHAMDEAAVAVCLISVDYLASDFCHKEEIPYLLERRERAGMVIIPVLLRPVLWERVPWLNEVQMLPRNGQAVTRDFKGEEDTVFAEVAERIFAIVNVPEFKPASPASLLSHSGREVSRHYAVFLLVNVSTSSVWKARK